MSSTSIVMITLILGSLAALYLATSSSKEGFWNLPSRTWKVEKVIKDGPDFVQTPSFQGLLSPRFSNVNYGPNLRTQLPDYAMFGVPEDPLGGNPTVVEGFSVGNPSNYTNGNYQQVSDTLNNSQYSNVPYTTNSLPQENLSYLTANGELKQPIVYDRFMFANRQSRLRSQGDWFRGDLPIVPMTGNWFVPSVHPNIDLNAGAINVMAGPNNETNNKLSTLIYNSSGGGDTTIGGVDLKMSGTQKYGSTVAAGGDVIVTSFP